MYNSDPHFSLTGISQINLSTKYYEKLKVSILNWFGISKNYILNYVVYPTSGKIKLS